MQTIRVLALMCHIESGVCVIPHDSLRHLFLWQSCSRENSTVGLGVKWLHCQMLVGLTFLFPLSCQLWLSEDDPTTFCGWKERESWWLGERGRAGGWKERESWWLRGEGELVVG